MHKLILKVLLLCGLGVLNAFGGQPVQQPPPLGGGSLVDTSVSSAVAESISALGVDTIVPNIDSLTDEGTASVADDLNKQ